MERTTISMAPQSPPVPPAVREEFLILTYNKQEKKKLLLRVFLHRLMILYTKLLLPCQTIERTKPSIEHKIHWIDNDVCMKRLNTNLLLNVLCIVYMVDYKK